MGSAAKKSSNKHRRKHTASRVRARMRKREMRSVATKTETVHISLRDSRKRLILLFSLCVAAFGIVMVGSASSGSILLQGYEPWVFLKRQLLFAAVGVVAYFIGARINLRLLDRFALLIVFACFLLLVAVMLPGVGHTVNGAARWIKIGAFQLQPSEFMKVALVVLVASHLANTPPPKHWLQEFIKSKGGIAYAVAAFLVIVQNDLGSAIMIGLATTVLYYAAGTSPRLLAGVLLPITSLGVLSIITEEFRRERFMAFINPGANPTGEGYQLIQAKLAIGSGGILGKGLGESVQKIHFLPEAHTDMIFAIVVEELGLLGSIFIIGSFSLLAAVGIVIAKNARSRFTSLLAIGITVMIVGQALINLAGVLGIMPLTGIPLPLVSYGGSSLIITLGCLGLLSNIATDRSYRAKSIPVGKVKNDLGVADE